jgi:hypothetical protein
MTLHEFLEALYGKVTEGYIGVSVMPTKDSIPKTTSVRRRLLPCMPSVPRSGRTPLSWPARSRRQGPC